MKPSTAVRQVKRSLAARAHPHPKPAPRKKG